MARAGLSHSPDRLSAEILLRPIQRESQRADLSDAELRVVVGPESLKQAASGAVVGPVWLATACSTWSRSTAALCAPSGSLRHRCSEAIRLEAGRSDWSLGLIITF